MPPIKIPTKPEPDEDRGFPFYTVKYFMFCDRCASAILGTGLKEWFIRRKYKLPKFKTEDVTI